jgi:NifB/MoaA-like Fe-S oxidoreductase
MVPLFMKESASVIRRVLPLGSFRASVVTGASSFVFVNAFLTQVSEKSGLDIVPVAVTNRLFGSSVTVSGLVAGNDISAEMADRNIGECLFVPDVMLKEGEGVFLDDISLAELERRLKRPVIVFDSTPAGFYKTLRQFGKMLQRR